MLGCVDWSMSTLLGMRDTLPSEDPTFLTREVSLQSQLPASRLPRTCLALQGQETSEEPGHPAFQLRPGPCSSSNLPKAPGLTPGSLYEGGCSPTSSFSEPPPWLLLYQTNDTSCLVLPPRPVGFPGPDSHQTEDSPSPMPRGRVPT